MFESIILQSLMFVTSEDESGGSGTSFEPITSQDEFDRRIQARIQREKDKQAALSAELETLKQKNEDVEAVRRLLEERDKELQSANEQVTQLQGETTQKDRQISRLEVASEKGVPAHRINGETREELEADADRYLEELQSQKKGLLGSYRAPGSESGTGGEESRTGTLQSGRERARARHSKVEAN